MVNAMLWILNTGSPWRDLPDRYGLWQTAYNRFNRWRKHARRIATRFEKLAVNFLAMLKLAMIQRYFKTYLRDTT